MDRQPENPFSPLAQSAYALAHGHSLRGTALDLQASRLPWWRFLAKHDLRQQADQAFARHAVWLTRAQDMSVNARLWADMMGAKDDDDTADQRHVSESRVR